jgi:HSP20 family protein
MAASPFHGIFSALNLDGQHGSAFPLGEEEQEPAAKTPAAGDRFPGGSGAQGQAGRVAVDIYEQDDYYIIKAPIAGVRLSDIDIEVNGQVLTIRGHRRQADQIPRDQYYVQECYWGEFSRSVTLPIDIDPKKVRATFNKESILKILIPKEEKVKIVKISEA